MCLDVVAQWRAVDEFHREVRQRPGVSVRRTDFVNLRDAGVLQPGQGIRFALETALQFRRRQAGLDDFQGDDAMRPLLFGLVHHAHTAFAHQLQYAIASDSCGNTRQRRVKGTGAQPRGRLQPDRCVEDPGALGGVGEQSLDFVANAFVGTGPSQEGSPLIGRLLERQVTEFFDCVPVLGRHGEWCGDSQYTRRHTMAERGDVTQLLAQIRGGDEQAAEQLVPLVYKELRKIAAAMMRRERPDHTLQPTAVVHEAFIRLMDGEQARFENRAHFFAIAARSMRRVLVDYARQRLADKRGGDARKVELEDDIALTPEQSADVLGLDEALGRLERLDARQAQIVEMHYFAGNPVAEIAEVCQISERTVKRELQTARLFLKQQLQSLE